MTINYPIELPDAPIESGSFKIINASTVNSSPFTLNQQAYNWRGQAWVISLKPNVVNKNTANEWRDFISKLQGRKGTFRAGDPMRSQPKGNANVPTNAEIAGTANAPYISYLQNFDNDDKVDFGSISISNSFTIQTWIRPTRVDGTKRVFLDNSDRFKFYINSSNNYEVSVGGTGIDSGVSATENEWNHVTLTWDNTGGEAEVFIDGSPAATSNSLSPGSATSLIAGTDTNDPYEGYMRDLAIWDDVRTNSEISNNISTKFDGNETDLSHYWPLDDGSDIQAANLASSDTGNVVGADWVNNEATTLSTRGWKANTTVLEPGDYIEIEKSLYIVNNKVVTTSDGTAQIVVQPNIRSNYDAGTDIIVDKPKGVFRLERADLGWDESDIRTTPNQIIAREVIQ